MIAIASFGVLLLSTIDVEGFAFVSGRSPKTYKTTSALLLSAEDEFVQETPEQTKQRIQGLVDENPVLLFMKGSKIFPQCGFSSTAVQILNTFGIEFHSGLSIPFNII